MNKAFVLAVFLGLPMLAAAQSPASTDAPTAAAASPGFLTEAAAQQERTRIGAQRLDLEAALAAEDAACYDKFLVNSCLDKVNVKRREAMSDLKRQEIILNDQERKQRAAEQLRKIEEKSSAATQEAAAQRRAQALKDTQDRAVRGDQKAVDRAKTDADAKSNVESAAAKQASRQAEAAARAEKQAGAAEEARKYEERQKLAETRRAENAERIKSKPAAKPLPVPP
ncbi:MAG: hypothetical protein EOO28_10080 [Comamonadaceae bacterium]|nr:MAG: hypothetical protein EOO28_10080 [Comamonadaceae bacterium]